MRFQLAGCGGLQHSAQFHCALRTFQPPQNMTVRPECAAGAYRGYNKRRKAPAAFSTYRHAFNHSDLPSIPDYGLEKLGLRPVSAEVPV
jgi:hypothetical protein